MGWTHFDKVSGINGIGVGDVGSELGFKILTATDTWNPANLTNGTQEAKEVTCAGASLGDLALACLSIDAVDVTITASVTAANTVTVLATNHSGGAVNLDSSTVRVLVIKLV